MYRGTTRQVAKVFDQPNGRQIEDIPANTTVTGDAPRGDGFVYIRTPESGYTKMQWLSGYQEVPTQPPPPPPPPTGEVTLTHTIDIFSNGSIKIDGNPYP